MAAIVASIPARVRAASGPAQRPLPSMARPFARAELGRIREKLEARAARLRTSRTELEARRRKQLWGIATALDEIAREEARRLDESRRWGGSLGGSVDAEEVTVDFDSDPTDGYASDADE
jgi:hypothetical protein